MREAQVEGAAGLSGAGWGFLQAVTIGWTGFWQVPVEGLGATTVGVVGVVGGVVVVFVVVPVVVPPDTTAAERETEAKTRAEQAKSSCMVRRRLG